MSLAVSVYNQMNAINYIPMQIVPLWSVGSTEIGAEVTAAVNTKSRKRRFFHYPTLVCKVR